MYALTFSLLLLPTAFAHRHHYGPGYRHSIHHRPLSGSAPYTSVTSNAPYGLGNTTTNLGSTGFATAVSTALSVVVSESSGLGGLGSSGAAPTSSVAAIDHAGNPGGFDGGATDDTTSCDSGVVTVTENPTYTVTVTPGQGSVSEVVPSSSVVLPASSPLSTKTVPISVAESSGTPSVASSAPTVVDTSSEVAQVPASTPEVVSTSALDATVASSDTPTSSPSIVTVVPIPASTSAEVEETTPSPTSTAQKEKVPATIVSSSSTPQSTSGLSSGVSSPGGCPGKRGIVATAGGPNGDQAKISKAFADQQNICWVANWYSAPPPGWPTDKEFIPQMYGKSTELKGWYENAQHAIDKGEKIFLSFGEPEADPPSAANNNQGGLNYQSPEDAADNYVKWMNPYAENDGVKLCSPAVLQPREHLDWLAKFLDICEAKKCRIDMICIHWFDTTTKDTPHFDEFFNTVNNATALAKGKKVWVDNFQANGIEDDVTTFLNKVIPWLEKNDNVERYAYVPPLSTDPNKYGKGFRTDQFIDGNGALTNLGKQYANMKMGA